MLGHGDLLSSVFLDELVVGLIEAILLEELANQEASVVLRCEVACVMTFGYLVHTLL